jgi:hypothetical protein
MFERFPARAGAAEVFDHDPPLVAKRIEGLEHQTEIDHAVLE